MNKNRLINVSDLFIIPLSALVIFALNYRSIINFLTKENPESLDILTSRATDFTDSIADFISKNLLTASVTTFIVWFILGLISYFIFSIVASETVDLSDAFNLSQKYLHPKNSRTNYWLRFVTDLILSTVLIVGFVIWLIFTINVFVPFSSIEILNALYGDERILLIVYNLLLSLGSMVLTLLVPIILYRLLKIIGNKIMFKYF